MSRGNPRRLLRAAVLRRALERAALRASLAAFLFPGLAACATVERIVGLYGGEEGLALLGRAAEGAEKIEDATLGNAVKVLPKYCLVPGAARSLFRARVNGRPEAEGALVAVWCPGDPTLTLGE